MANYFKHHIGDYAAATAHLSWDEDMAYTRLLRCYYHEERAIARDDVYRKARATTPAQRKAVDAVLKDFFTLESDGCYHQRRCDEELLGMQAKAAVNAAVGRRGGRPRKSPVGQASVGGSSGASGGEEKNPNGFQTETQTVSENDDSRNQNVTLANSHKPIANSQYSSSSGVGGGARKRADDDKPLTVADWVEVFQVDHGVAVDACNAHHRSKFWPLADGWIAAGVTVGKMRQAVERARSEATEVIAYLPAYVDRVLASMSRPATVPAGSAAEPAWRAEQRARTLAAVPGIAAVGPDGGGPAPVVIDVTPADVIELRPLLGVAK